jgi:ribose/xylose/arabinose/galactoside ABC-type transport system permease subunit
VKNNELGKTIPRVLVSNGFYLVFVILFLFYTFSSEYFLTVLNIRNILSDAASIMVICTGLAFVIMTGSLDLSVGSVAFLCASITSLLIKGGQPVVLSLLFGMTAGIVVGAVNGVLVALLNFNPLLVTLGMMIGLRGITMHLTKGWQIYIPTEVKKLAIDLVGPVQRIVILALIVIILGQLVLKRTRFGRYVTAVGCSGLSAKRIGLNVRAIRFSVFVVSGTLAALGGIIAMMNMGVLQPTLGRGLEFIAVAAIVMGGTSLFGGQGSMVPGTLFGVLMLGIIENGLALLAVSPFAYPLVRGVVIFVAMYADSLKNSRLAIAR